MLSANQRQRHLGRADSVDPCAGFLVMEAPHSPTDPACQRSQRAQERCAKPDTPQSSDVQLVEEHAPTRSLMNRDDTVFDPPPSEPHILHSRKGPHHPSLMSRRRGRLPCREGCQCHRGRMERRRACDLRRGQASCHGRQAHLSRHSACSAVWSHAMGRASDGSPQSDVQKDGDSNCLGLRAAVSLRCRDGGRAP